MVVVTFAHLSLPIRVPIEWATDIYKSTLWNNVNYVAKLSLVSSMYDKANVLVIGTRRAVFWHTQYIEPLI